MDSCSNWLTITDCFGTQYRIAKMPGSGFCLYHSLSYCLTGNDVQFADIIDDCLTVFQNIPELFRLRTNFGSYNNSSSTLDEYVSYMQHAIQLVQTGHSVDSHAYGDEGHIAAIALLYDITVYTYSMQNKTWYVLNESGRHGYVCLLHLPNHFDVLHGIDESPAIPLGVHTQGVNRHDFDTPVDVWQSLQRSYSFQNVFRFPEHYSGVEILNNPVVQYAETSTLSSVAVDKYESSPYACQYEQCTFVGKTAQGLCLHKRKRHDVNNASNKNNSLQRCSHGSQLMQQQSTTGNCDNIDVAISGRGHFEVIDSECAQNVASTQHVCDSEQCKYVAKTSKALQMHKIRCHHVKERSQARQSHKTTPQLRATAKKRTASFADSWSECYSSAEGQHNSDKVDETLLHESAGMTGDIRRRKTTRRYIDMDVEPDSASDNTVMSTVSGLRRSVRISDRKSKCEDGKSHTDVSDNVESISKKVVKISNRNTQKGHIKKSFSRVISDCERDVIPKNVSQQNDPLYDRLKAYHDDLLKSVSNTTTEKISAEIDDVVENVSLVDSHDRRYQWSLSDQDRLNELNSTCKLLQPRTQWTWGAPDDSEQGQYNDKRMQPVSYTHLTLPTIYSV